jgi:hypothetical protein
LSFTKVKGSDSDIDHSVDNYFDECFELEIVNTKGEKLFNAVRRISESTNINDSQRLIITKEGLKNQISKYQGYTIIGTSSKKLELAEIDSDYNINDDIDIFLSLEAKENYQCFFISYIESKHKLI